MVKKKRGTINQQLEFIDEAGIVEDSIMVLKSCKNLCLLGETGTGKTTLSHFISKTLDVPLFEHTLSIDTNRWELVASDVLEKGETKVREGIVLMWLKATKGVLLLNGFNYAPANVISLFESIADWTDKIYIPELQKEFVRSGEHYLIITMNPYEKCLSGNSYISTPKGFKMLKTFRGLCATNQNGNIEMVEPIKYSQKTVNNICKIRTQTTIIEASDEHKFQVVKNGKFEWKEARNLDIGDKVLAVKKLPTGDVEPEFTQEFAQFLGYYTGDGHVLTRDVGVGLTDKNTETLLRYQGKINTLYKYPITSTRVGNISGRNRLLIYSKEFAQLVKHYIPNKSRFREIPQAIMQAPKQWIAGYLRGLYDAEGCIGKRGFSYTLIFSTTSGRLAVQVSLLLRTFGIIATINRANNKAKLFNVVTSDIEMMKIFADKVGFENPKKTKKLAEAVSGESKRSRLNSAVSKKEARVMLMEQGYRQRDLPYDLRHVYSRDGYLSLRALKSFLELVKNVKYAGYFLDTVKSVEHLWKEETYYDLTMPTENYVANGLIVHNSGYAGTHQMNIATMRRFEPIYVHYLSPQKETGLVQNYYKEYEWVRKLVEFASKTRTLYREGKLTMPLTTGNLINYAKLKKLGMSDAKIVSIACAHYLEEERPNVKRLWEETDGDN